MEEKKIKMPRNFVFYKIISAILRFLLLFVIRIKIRGRENLPKTGGFILACNHISNFDPVILVARLGRPVCFMGKDELFKNPLMGYIFSRGMKVFPVKRGAGDSDAIDYGAALIKSGHILGIFPEGRRYKVGEPGRAKSGVAIIARMTGADVLPMGVTCSGKPGFFNTFTFTISPIIRHEELGFAGGDDKREIKAAANMIMDAINRSNQL